MTGHPAACPVCKRPETGLHHSSGSMIICRCPDCSMMFQPPESPALKDADLITRLYEEFLSDPAAHVSLNEDRLERLRGLLGRPLKGLRVLEIGSGSGALGDLLLKEGALYAGLEPTAACHAILIRRYPALKGLVRQAYFDQAGFPKNSFDLIVMNDALEHIPGPVEFLSGLKPYLAAGGRLHIEAPSEAFIGLKAVLRGLFGLYGGCPTNPEHISLFTARSLRLAIAAAGLAAGPLFQVTVWGDPAKLRIALRGRFGWLAGPASLFFRLTRLDLLLQQGLLVAQAYRISGAGAVAGGRRAIRE